MFRHVLNAIIDEFDTGLCLRDIANHWQCRCTVPGPGMRQAGEILWRRYLENGAAEAELIPYPADDRTEYLDGAKNQMEWRPHGASLSIVSPAAAAGTICRYDDEPLCLICYSLATPPEGVEAEVVVHDGPLPPDQVTEGQWAGRIVFTDQFPSTVAGAVGKSGAVGLISDCVSPPWLVQHPPVREPEDVPDLTMWTIFSGHRDQPRIFGFNLTPRQGRRLRQLIATSAEPVRLRAIVDAETVEGSSDFVYAVLPGTERPEEEIWVLAHLSEPGARDNGSGCCVSLELMRTLAKLTREGKLQPLKRTIRFMHGVEVSGFLPYINEHKHRLPQVLAGLCADSLAQDFTRCGGEMVLFLSPEQNGSFIDGLVQTLLTAVAAEPVRRFTTANYAAYPWHTEPFFGNDAFISDGFFDIPSPQLSTWPDKYYHSNLDRPEDIDDSSLGRVGGLAGTLLYLLANAGAAEARWLGMLAAQDFKQRIAGRLNEIVAEAQALPLAAEDARRHAAELWHLGLQGQDAVTQAGRFAADDARLQANLETIARDLGDFAGREAGYVLTVLAFEPTPPALATFSHSADGAGLVARRRRWHLSAEAKVQAEGKVGESLDRIWPWINGRRTALQIAERLEYGGSVELETVVAALQALAEAGLVDLK